MPEIRRGEAVNKPVAVGVSGKEEETEGLWMRNDVHRCWYCKLCRTCVVNAEMGSVGLPDCEMRVVRDEGAGIDVVVVVDILRSRMMLQRGKREKEKKCRSLPGHFAV
jgi:hypothetical protein